MGSAGDYLELKVLDHVFGKTTFTSPDPVYIALFSAAPTDAGGGTEVSYTSYVRKSVANDKTTWTNAAAGALANNIDISFVASTGGTPPNVTHFAVFDSAIGGSNNLLGWGALATSRTINTGDVPKFLAGSLAITLD